MSVANEITIKIDPEVAQRAMSILSKQIAYLGRIEIQIIMSPKNSTICNGIQYNQKKSKIWYIYQ